MPKVSISGHSEFSYGGNMSRSEKKIIFLVAKSERIKHLVNCNSSLERGTKSFKKRKIRSGVADVGIRSEEGPSFPCSLLQRVLADISLRGKGRS